MSGDLSDLYRALAGFQSEVPPIPKTKTGTVKGRNKSGTEYSYEYRYADLADLLGIALPVLAKHGLCLFQTIEAHDGIEVCLTHLAHVSGAEIVSEHVVGPVDIDMQSRGGRLTYSRRYSAAAILGISPDDDLDAQGAEAPAKPEPRSPRVRKTTEPEQQVQNVLNSTEPEPSDHERLTAAVAKARGLGQLNRLIENEAFVAALDALDNIEGPLVRAAIGAKRQELQSHQLSQRAALAAKSESFRRWVLEAHGVNLANETETEEWQRLRWGIASRSALDTDPMSGNMAKSDLDSFEAWLHPRG